jgi:hypothetical protein
MSRISFLNNDINEQKIKYFLIAQILLLILKVSVYEHYGNVYK